MPRQTQSTAPDVANADGTVTRVTTQTIVFQPAEYARLVAAQQRQAQATAAVLPAMQAVAAQSAAAVAAPAQAASGASIVVTQ